MASMVVDMAKTYGHCPELARVQLGVASEFVLAAIKPHGRLMGIIYADNLYSRVPVTADQIKYFSFFIDQTEINPKNTATSSTGVV